MGRGLGELGSARHAAAAGRRPGAEPAGVRQRSTNHDIDVTTIDANKALVRRAIGYNHGAADQRHRDLRADFVAYMPGQPPMDRATFEQYRQRSHDRHARLYLRDPRSDCAGRPGRQSRSPGEACTRAPGRRPATGRSIELRGINMFRVKDGRVVEQWAELDMLGLLQQIGAIPRRNAPSLQAASWVGKSDSASDSARARTRRSRPWALAWRRAA